jgi:multicomponent Na+:H+ antiporter subunit E
LDIPEEKSMPKLKMGIWQAKWAVITIEFVLLFLFWLLLSGSLHPKEIIIGICSAAIVTYLTNDLLYNPRRKKSLSSIGRYIFSSAIRLLVYTPWLVWAIIKANIQIAIIILKPSMPINPILLKFSTRMNNKVSLVTLGNSITLTPGTLTVDLKNNTYIVHCLVREAAGDLESGVMQNKVGAVFADHKDNPPETIWASSFKELEQ